MSSADRQSNETEFDIMGQCNGIPLTSGYEGSASFDLADYAGREKEKTAAALPWSIGPMIPGTSCNHRLERHKADPPSKCIVEQSQVIAFLKERDAPTLEHQPILLEENDLCQDIMECDSQSVVFDDHASTVNMVDGMFGDLSSTFAPSVATTGTAATQPVANYHKSMGVPAANARKSRPSFDVLGEIGAHRTTQKRGTTKKASAKPESKRKQTSVSSSSSVYSAASNEEVTPLSVGSYARDLVHCMASTHATNPYLRPIQLKIKSPLFEFYDDLLLATFPDLPRPHLLDRKGSDFPTLASASDGSASSSCSDSLSVDFGGSGPTCTPVLMASDETSFLDLGVVGSLGLVERRISSKTKQRPFITLINRRSSIPLAVCALKAKSNPPIVRIYTTKPHMVDQRPTTTTDRIGIADYRLPLYAFAEVSTHGNFPEPLDLMVFSASGTNGKFDAYPSYQATCAAKDSLAFSVVGRTRKEFRDSGCATMEYVPEPDSHIRLSVAPGLDPALFVCLAAVADEVLEDSIRHHLEDIEERLFSGRRLLL